MDLLLYMEIETGHFFHEPRNHRMTEKDLEGLVCLSGPTTLDINPVRVVHKEPTEPTQNILEEFFEAS